MRFLMVTTLYPTAPGHSWMSSDLADELTRQGHQVDVVLLDWTAPAGRATRQVVTDTGVTVVSIAPRAIESLGPLMYRVSKMLFSQRHAVAEAKAHLNPADYDALIAFTPASTLGGLLTWARLIPARMLFIFDFYPWMQREVGVLPAPAFRFALRRETALMRGFTTLACTLAGNVRYLRYHYAIDPEQMVITAPLWSDVTPVERPDRDATRRRYDLPLDRPIAIFGGQMTVGRGIELMIDAAREAERAGSDLLFLFVGNGSLADRMSAEAMRSANLVRLPGMARSDYLALASACDAGMAATVPGVTSFNFPTKTIDYLRVGLPVCAAVEPGSDFVDILSRYRVGVSADFTDPSDFFRSIAGLVADSAMRRDIAENARRCLDEVFDVRHAAARVLEAVDAASG